MTCSDLYFNYSLHRCLDMCMPLCLCMHTHTHTYIQITSVSVCVYMYMHTHKLSTHIQIVKQYIYLSYADLICYV